MAGYLFRLLFDMSTRSCADPRDHVFALAGFCGTNTPQITVDYSLDCKSVYTAFARDCITQSYMQVLCFAGVGYDKATLQSSWEPSWVPDWRVSGRGRGSSHPRPLDYSFYSAGGRQPSRLTVNQRKDGQTSLKLDGAILGTLVGVLEGWSNWQKPWNTQWKSLFLQDGYETHYFGGIPILQAYLRTIVADMNPGVRNKRLHRNAFGTDLEKPTFGGLVVHFLVQHFLKEHEASEPDREALLKYPRSEKIAHPSRVGHFFSEEDEPGPDSWSSWIQSSLTHRAMYASARRVGIEGRSIFKTSNGYMGTGPPYAKPGDEVCIFQGVNVPFLIRPNRDGYLLVGEAFVLGLMDGEYTGGFEEIVMH